VDLYKWILKRYAKEDDKILDTHLGSGSIAIACDSMGFDLVGCELDKEYYDNACKRLEPYRLQSKLF
ncbi:MAG: DNA methyltransferase, partial [Planctomycetota bacterium]